MRTKLFSVVAGAALLVAVAAVPVIAHHSFAAEFDAKRPVKLRGTVVKMEWINPHSWIHIDVKTRRRQGRALDGRGRRAERAAPPRLEQEVAARGHRDPRRGLPGQGRREPRQRPRHHLPGRQEAVRRLVGHRRAGRETREVSSSRCRLTYEATPLTGIGLGVALAQSSPRRGTRQVFKYPRTSDAHTSTLEAVSAARWRIAISLTIAMMVVYFGFILLVAFNKPLLGTLVVAGPEPRHAARRARHRRRVGADLDLRAVGEHALRRVAARAAPMTPRSASRTSPRSPSSSSSSRCRSASPSGRRARRARPSSSTPPAAASPRCRTASRWPATT